MTPGPPRRGAEVGPFPPYDEAGRDTTYGGAGRDTTYGGPGRAGEPGYDAGETGEAGSGDEYGDGSYDATARVVDPTLEGSFDADDERRVEAALRPKRLAEIAGQTRVREQLGLVLEAARRRGTPPDHMLLSGPPGLGKTTLAMIVAAELEAPIRVTSGPAIQHAGDLASILSSLTEGEVLFLDEIHRMSRAAEEMLYLAMEDFRVDIVVGKGPGATAIPLELAPFTVVAATTRAGLLPAPLRDRFGFTGHLDYYEVDDLVAIILRSARLLGVATDEAGVSEIARRSRGTPRIANRLLRRVRDWAQVHGQDVVDRDAAMAALALFDVDSAGLDRLDRAVLDALCRRFAGGPVGLTTLAVAVGEEPDTVETVAEPYLVREGFMIRTPRGRAATAAAWAHLGLAAPPGAPGAPGGAAWAGTSGGAAPSAPAAGGGLPGLRQDELPWGGTTGRF
jgi:Holliday junction DNA helicase RuvB